MQVSIEATGGLERRMTVAVPAAQFEQEFADRLKRLSRTARLPGFRPGRAPLRIVEAQYGGKLLDEVAQDLMRDSFYAALTQEGLKAAGGPAIEPKALVRGQDMQYVATFEVYPEVVRLDLKGIPVERYVCEVTDADVDRTLEVMRKQRTTWSPVDRACTQGDRVIIDFVGKIDGAVFAGGSAQGHTVILGAGSLLPAFEAGLVGAKSAETRDIEVPFPDDYGATTLAGKTATFTVTFQEVAEPVLPTLDAAFAASLGVAEGIDVLRTEVRQNLEREAARRIRERVKGEIFKQLRGVNAIELPSQMVESEAQRLRETAQSQLASQGMATEGLPADNGPFRERARERVALGIILSEFVRSRRIKADPAKVRQRVEEMAADYDDPARFIEWYYSKPERVAEAESLVLEDEAVTLLLGEAQVAEKSVRFEELA